MKIKAFSLNSLTILQKHTISQDKYKDKWKRNLTLKSKNIWKIHLKIIEHLRKIKI